MWKGRLKFYIYRCSITIFVWIELYEKIVESKQNVWMAKYRFDIYLAYFHEK